MSKPLHGVICLLAIVLINRIECIKLTKENVISLGGVNGRLSEKEITEIDPAALEVVESTTLRLYDNKLTYLQEDLFQYNTNFIELYLYRDKISKIHPLVFQKLQNLTWIYLSSNELTDIPENLFERNTKLKKIYLHENRITFFQPNTFKNLNNLVLLYAFSNQLTSFDLNLFSSTKELQWLYLYDNNLTDIHYQDLKLRFPKLEWVSFTENKFNCSFAKQFSDYLVKRDIKEYFVPISCISDEEYAAIVGDRQINTPESSLFNNMQLNLEDQCYNITMELKSFTTSLNLQLLEKESVIEKIQNDSEKVKNELKSDIEDLKDVIEGLKSQLQVKELVIEKMKNDSETTKIDYDDVRSVTKGLNSQLLQQQSVIEKMKIEFEDMKEVSKGQKLQLLEQQSVTDKLKAATESCCQVIV